MENKDTERATEMSAHIEARRASGMTVISYCKLHGLVPSNYYYWKKRLQPIAAKPGGFTEVAVPVNNPAAVSVRFPKGVSITFEAVNVLVLKQLVFAKA